MNIIKKILIIDDDETACYINEIFLKDMQISEDVVCIQDATEALDYIKKIFSSGSYDKNGPDLILLDINMPIMNGFEFLEKIKLLRGIGKLCSQRVVIHSSSMLLSDIEKANSYGVLAYIQKPLTAFKLKRIITAYYSQPA